VESYIIEQVRRIILERSLSYNETLPDVGNIPIFPDRQEYKVEIQLFNKMIWVEFHRDQLAIDAFEIIVQDGKVICIEHLIVDDQKISIPTHYKRNVLEAFEISAYEFLKFWKRKEREEKLKRLFSKL
jgi:hypothetical protein